jgi:hypothetical protein
MNMTRMKKKNNLAITLLRYSFAVSVEDMLKNLYPSQIKISSWIKISKKIHIESGFISSQPLIRWNKIVANALPRMILTW